MEHRAATSDVDPVIVARQIDRTARAQVGDALVGTYLHGSAALGGFVVGRSDVDLLLVVDDGVTGDQLGAPLIDTAGPSTGRRVELSVIRASFAAQPCEPWPFVIHIATGESGSRLVVGAEHPGDPDLALHVAVCRGAGIVISGPAPDQVFGQVEHETIIDALRRELRWAVESADATYALLNACRAWRYAATRDLVSKLDGAAWVVEQTDDPGTLAAIRASVSRQRGHETPPPTPDAASGFVAAVLGRLTPP